MERLTNRLSDGTDDYYMACSETCDAEIGDCAECRSMDEIVNRLGAYEDTGLTPEEVAEYKKFEDEAVSKGVPFSRIVELLNADKDGRLLVLPCKVGDTVWVTGRDHVAREMRLEPPNIRAVCTDEDNLCAALCNRKPDGFCAYRLRNDGADMNKTVFLTRKEAEQALKEAKEDG